MDGWMDEQERRELGKQILFSFPSYFYYVFKMAYKEYKYEQIASLFLLIYKPHW